MAIHSLGHSRFREVTAFPPPGFRSGHSGNDNYADAPTPAAELSEAAGKSGGRCKARDACGARAINRAQREIEPRIAMGFVGR